MQRCYAVAVRTSLALAVLLVSATAAADEPMPEQPYGPDEPADAATSASPELRDDPGWQLYHNAFSALARGDRTEARAIIDTLERDHPGHPAIALAHRAFDADLVGVPAPIDPVVGRERRTQSATSELALFQTVNGLTIGIELCLVVQCESGASGFGLALAGSAIGAYATLHGDRVAPGTRAAFNSATAWSALNASFGVTQEHASTQSGAAAMMLGQLGGVAIGAVVSQYRPTAGQVALANTGGEWGLALSTLTITTIHRGLILRDQSLYIAASPDVGIGVGAYLSHVFPDVSRAQTLVIDAGGIAGGFAGGTLGVIITGNTSDRPVYALAGVGVLAGLFTATYLTRNWHDDNVSPLSASIVPTDGGGMLSAHMRW